MTHRKAIIHRSGLFPKSDGTGTSWCGIVLPCTTDHFHILGCVRPRGARNCRRCDAIYRTRVRQDKAIRAAIAKGQKPLDTPPTRT